MLYKTRHLCLLDINMRIDYRDSANAQQIARPVGFSTIFITRGDDATSVNIASYEEPVRPLSVQLSFL